MNESLTNVIDVEDFTESTSQPHTNDYTQHKISSTNVDEGTSVEC